MCPNKSECKIGRLNFGHRLKITFIKLLKFYYTPITMTALNMTHCVKIHNNHHLFVYGDYECFTAWQIAIMVVILPGILLFPVGFELSLRLLKGRYVSSTTFVASTACPYLGIVLYLLKIKFPCTKTIPSIPSPDEEVFVQTILEVEEELFTQDEGAFGWQIVQFYRTLAMNIIVTLITNPVYLTLAFLPVLLVFVLHDREKRPFKDTYLNILQPLSSGCLLLLLGCNVVSSVSFIVDISMVPWMSHVVGILAIVEMLIHACVPLSLPLWMVYKFIQNKRSTKKTE